MRPTNAALSSRSRAQLVELAEHIQAHGADSEIPQWLLHPYVLDHLSETEPH